MAESRREFLARTAAVLGSAAAVAQTACTGPQGTPPPGTPPVVGTAPAVGPAVDAATFAAAEKLVQVDLTEAERAAAVANWRNGMATLYERRVGPRKVALNPTLAPGSVWNPVLPGTPITVRDRFVGSGRDPGPVPTADAQIALAPLWKLSGWIEKRRLTSERLT